MVFVIILLVVLFVAFWWLGGKELVGEWLTGLFPVERLKKGDKVDVFLDGKYNRTATITGVTSGSMLIYDRLPLPVDYRGTFYATGVDQNDGSKLVYVKNRKHFKLVRAAELVKKVFNVLDDAENLIPEDPVMVEAATMGAAADPESESETETEEAGDGL